MDPNLRTLSLSAWMSLPGFDFHTWDRLNSSNESVAEDSQIRRETTEVENSPLQRRNLALKQKQQKGPTPNKVQTRALISRVAQYYESYVREMGLEKNFYNNVTVTNVFPVRVHGHQRQLKMARWMVVG